MEDYERVLLVKQEVFVFKIPSRTSIKNYRYPKLFFCSFCRIIRRLFSLMFPRNFFSLEDDDFRRDFAKYLVFCLCCFYLYVLNFYLVYDCRAADWNLNEPQWSGRMRMVAIGISCIVFLEDKTNGELFAKCPIDNYPGVAVEPVSDSSRYFVLRIQDDNGSPIIPL